MLVRDPDKRYTIEQIKKHRWLLADGPLKQIHSFKPVNRCGVVENGVSNNQEEYNEHVLRLMDQIGMERQKTIEVSYRTSAAQLEYGIFPATWVLCGIWFCG